jgi:alpha-tubulin suppressor-like RCC1 family protein
MLQLGTQVVTCANGAWEPTGICFYRRGVLSAVRHTCALDEQGAVYCWGDAGGGKLGPVEPIGSRAVPTVVSGLSGMTGIAAGATHTCALDGAGGVVCWGESWQGQLGDGVIGTISGPVQVSGLTDAVAVATGAGVTTSGGQHSCALRANGQVACWGRGEEGQLGYGGLLDQATPVAVSGVTDAVAVAAAGKHACAVHAGGTVSCWGRGSQGQLGGGNHVSSSVPVAVGQLANAVDIVAANQFSCALLEGGAVSCWGTTGGNMGYFGPSPVAVASIADAVALSAGDSHACALRATGSVVCWGRGMSGQLGDGGTTDGLVPVTVSGLSDAVAVAAGHRHSCALRANGERVCWGSGMHGEVGNGWIGNGVDDFGANVPSLAVTLPLANVVGLEDATAVSTGRNHTCALRATGAVVCWGSSSVGILGNGSTAPSDVPVVVTGLDDAVAVSSGQGHTCAVRANGEAMCWGSSWYGRLGDGNGVATIVPIPTSVLGLTDVVGIASGGRHSCATRESGTVACWGNGQNGQMGDGSTEEINATFRDTSNLDDVLEVAAGDSHSCARRATGELACWGKANLGQMGNGQSTSFDGNFPTPVPVMSIADATAISVGVDHSCALHATGGVSCWGDGYIGQLGNGATVTSNVPVTVQNLTDAIAVSAGKQFSCAVRQSGSVVCWGYGLGGQLGVGGRHTTSAPIAVANVADAVAVSAGGDHACALRATGQVACWGSNLYGRIGAGPQFVPNWRVPQPVLWP